MKYLFLIFFLHLINFSFAQKKKAKLETDTIPTLKLTVEERKKEEEKKQKKMKKNVFYEKKCRKMFTRMGEGKREVIEVFYVLKTYEEPNPYLKEVYWYDSSKDKIMNVKMKPQDQANALILHGPYKKTIGGNIIEQGVFYVGAKHARWEKYDLNFTLMEKLKYYKGFPKDAEIKYYDSNRSKIEEVIPKQNGVIEGDYISYYPSGNIKSTGKYKNGIKIGLWTDYYDISYRRKLETQYPKSILEKDFVPFKLREWDEKGKISYDKLKDDKNKKAFIPKELEQEEEKEELESDSLNTLELGN